MKIRKVLPGALLLFLCLLCLAGIACYFFHTEPQPAIQQEKPRLVGTRDIVIGAGDPIPDLKEGLGVNDAIRRVEVDTSAIDTGTAGTYPVIYRYTDVQGNTYEVETTCTVTAAERENTAQIQQEKDGQMQGTQEETGQMEERKEMVQTAPPQTGDWTDFLKYAVLFLASVFMSLFLLLRRYFFG